jgi:hypothetical protein
MKSSAHKALASLQHKYQTKICQLGLAYRKEAVLEERIKDLQSDLRLALTTVHVECATDGAISSHSTMGSADHARTIERLEFDLRTANAALAQGRGRAVLQQDVDQANKAKVVAQNNAQAARDEASKWENWACAYATWALVASAALGIVGYKYAVLTGLL